MLVFEVLLLCKQSNDFSILELSALLLSSGDKIQKCSQCNTFKNSIWKLHRGITISMYVLFIVIVFGIELKMGTPDPEVLEKEDTHLSLTNSSKTRKNNYWTKNLKYNKTNCIIIIIIIISAAVIQYKLQIRCTDFKLIVNLSIIKVHKIRYSYQIKLRSPTPPQIRLNYCPHNRNPGEEELLKIFR